MKKEIILIHPYKHHIHPAIAAMQQSGIDVQFVTLFYHKGPFAKAISLLPGKIGQKAKGYYNLKIDRNRVLAPLCWQLARLFPLINQEWPLKRFDEWCAAKILSGQWQARAFHLLQDYLPETARSVVKMGAILVSDQILNASTEARERLKKSLELAGTAEECHFAASESPNDWILAHASHVLAPSEYTRQGIVGRAITKNITVIPYGVDVTAFVPKHQAEHASDIHIVARAPNGRKGGHLLISALAHAGEKLTRFVGGKNIKVNIVGDLSKNVKELYKKYRETLLDASISITYGNVAHRDMPKLLSHAHLFIMPALSESMSLIAIEAAACALPLLITPYCGIDAFETGNQGILIEETTEQSVADALLQAFKQYQDWPRMGKAAREMALEYSQDRYESEMGQFYEDLLSK